MATYRLYCFSGLTGRVTAAEQIAASSDEEAIAASRALKMRVKCELWQRDRLVAVLEPDSVSD